MSMLIFSQNIQAWMVQLKHSRYILYSDFLHSIILILGCNFLDYVYFTVTIQLPSSKIKVSLARVIKKFKLTILSHPSHTGLSHIFAIAVRISQPRSRAPPSFPSLACSYKRSAVGQGLKSSQITREYTYFRKNRVQIRKSHMRNIPTSLIPTPPERSYYGLRTRSTSFRL